MNPISLITPDPVHIAITAVIAIALLWVLATDWQGPEGRL